MFGGVYNNAPALRATWRTRDIGTSTRCSASATSVVSARIPTACTRSCSTGVHVLQGNYDESLAIGRTDCGCGYTDPRDNHFARISYEYTFSRTSAEHRAWLARCRATGSCAGRAPGAHVSRLAPGDQRVPVGVEHARGCCGPAGPGETDVLLCTHTGMKWHRALGDGPHAVNVGVVGRPENDGTTNVWYSILTAAPDLQVEFVPVAYDHEALAREMDREQLPPEFVETIRTGWWTTCLENLPAKERARGKY